MSTDEKKDYDDGWLSTSSDRSHNDIERQQSALYADPQIPPGLPERPQPALLPPARVQRMFGDSPNFVEKTNTALTKARIKSKWLTLPRWLRFSLRILGYMALACFIYFVCVGIPLWHGLFYTFWYVYKNDLNLKAGVAIFIAVSLLYSLMPLLCFFEDECTPTEKDRSENAARAAQTALVLACHKSANILPETLTAALKTFPASNVFIIDNARSTTPPDDTIDVCRAFGVRHIYVPIASKIAAQFIGVQAAHGLPYVLMIDDDVVLPDYFPVCTNRLQSGKRGGLVKCIGYAIRSVGANMSPGTFAQQAQAFEYLQSGLMRDWLGRWGSAVFPHGAISLWDRSFLEACFRAHPGFTVSEDWFLGHVARSLAGRIKFCSQVIVTTETPAHLVRSHAGSRAGYGEMTVTKQRMLRWNFFLVSRVWYNLIYLIFRWRMGRFEVGAKLWVFKECYETLLFLAFPLVFPIAVGANPRLTLPVTVGVILMYYFIAIITNEIHLRRRGVMVARRVIFLYLMPYLTFLRLVGVASAYISIFNYVRYYTRRHPKVTEDEEVLRVMLALANKPYDTEFDPGRDLPGVQRHEIDPV